VVRAGSSPSSIAGLFSSPTLPLGPQDPSCAGRAVKARFRGNLRSICSPGLPSASLTFLPLSAKGIPRSNGLPKVFLGGLPGYLRCVRFFLPFLHAPPVGDGLFPKVTTVGMLRTETNNPPFFALSEQRPYISCLTPFPFRTCASTKPLPLLKLLRRIC